MNRNESGGLSRRSFLRFTGSSVAAAVLAGCAIPGQPAPGADGGAESEPATIQAYMGGALQPNQPRGEGLNELTMYRTVADEWQAMQPDYAIEFIKVPTMTGNDYATWVKSNQAAGTMPDLAWAQDNYINRDLGAGYWLPLDEFIDGPNTYAPADHPMQQRWRDGFIAGFDARGRSTDGHYYLIPQGFSAVQVVYNKDILDEAGVDTSNLDNWSFDDMLGISAQIEQAGYTPWSLAWIHPNEAWIVTSSLSGFLKATGRFAQLDKNDDDFVEVRERWEGILEGTWAADTPEMRAMWQLAQDWTPYWMEGFLGATQEEALALFLRGESAFMWNGTWYYPTLKNDPQRTFDFDVVRFPLINDRMRALGDGEGAHNTYPGGVANQIAVTSTTLDNGTTEAAVDFLRYATTPDSSSRITAEHGGEPPAVIGAVGNPELDRFQPRPGETFLKTIHMRSMHLEYGEIYLNLQAEWLAGNLSFDDALAQLQEAMNRFARDAMEQIEGS